MAGFTPEQRELLEQRYCPQGHRFDGANYPTPEGVCPLCAWPEIRHEIDRYQRLLADYIEEQPRVALHPSLVTGDSFTHG